MEKLTVALAPPKARMQVIVCLKLKRLAWFRLRIGLCLMSLAASVAGGGLSVSVEMEGE